MLIVPVTHLSDSCSYENEVVEAEDQEVGEEEEKEEGEEVEQEEEKEQG